MGKAITEIDSYTGPVSASTKIPVSDSDTLQAATAAQLKTYCATDIAATTHSATGKTTPADADEVPLVDSAASNVLKKLTWTNIKATLKTYFDTLYQASAANLTSWAALAPSTKQDTLVSATNIKTINSTSLLGSGDLTVSASPGGSTTQVQYNSAGAFAGASGITTTGTELAIASGTQTTSKPILDLSQTWNAAGVTFTGRKTNITDTSSAAGSLIEDWQVGGDSKFALKKTGGIRVGSASGAYSAVGSAANPAIEFYIYGSGGYGFYHTTGGLYYSFAGFVNFAMSNADVAVRSDGGYAFCSSTSAAGVYDTRIARPSAGVLEINNGTTGTPRDLKLRNLIGTGNLATGIAAKTADYTATANDGTIEVDASGAARTITLPAVTGLGGRIYIVKKTDSSGNAVTVDANASETIDGATTVSLASQYSTIIIQANAAGTAWHKLASV